MRNPIRRLARGLTLIETSVTTAIVATVLGTALPQFDSMKSRHRLDAVVAQLETDLILARSEAVMRNESMHVAFAQDAFGSCYVLHSGDRGDCSCSASGSTTCQAAGTAVRSVHLPAETGVTLSANSTSVLFDAVKGTVSPTLTVRAQSSAGELRAIVNIMGRVRTCASGAGLAGHPNC